MVSVIYEAYYVGKIGVKTEDKAPAVDRGPLLCVFTGRRMKVFS